MIIITKISKRTKNMKFIKHLNKEKIINLSLKNIYIGRVSYHLAKMIPENYSGRHFGVSIIWLLDLTVFFGKHVLLRVLEVVFLSSFRRQSRA